MNKKKPPAKRRPRKPKPTKTIELTIPDCSTTLTLPYHQLRSLLKESYTARAQLMRANGGELLRNYCGFSETTIQRVLEEPAEEIEMDATSLAHQLIDQPELIGAVFFTTFLELCGTFYESQLAMKYHLDLTDRNLPAATRRSLHNGINHIQEFLKTRLPLPLGRRDKEHIHKLRKEDFQLMVEYLRPLWEDTLGWFETSRHLAHTLATDSNEEGKLLRTFTRCETLESLAKHVVARKLGISTRTLERSLKK